MKIEIEKDVFPDDNYCSISGEILKPTDRCGHAWLSLCHAFVNEDFSPIHREYDQDYGAFKKIDQCKVKCKKAKRSNRNYHMLKAQGKLL